MDTDATQIKTQTGADLICVYLYPSVAAPLYQTDLDHDPPKPDPPPGRSLSASSSHFAAAADTINRKREKPVSGEVSGMSKTEVTIKVTAPKADTIKVTANDIASIAWNGEPPECNVARKDEEGGRYQKAIDGYQKSMQSGKATNPNFKIDLEFWIARATGKMALADSSKIDDAVKKLEDFQKKQTDNYRFYDGVHFLGQLYAAKKDLPKAKQAFDTLGKAPWKEYQMAAKDRLRTAGARR